MSFDLTALSGRVFILNSCTYSVHNTASKGSQDAIERKIIRYILVFGTCVDIERPFCNSPGAFCPYMQLNVKFYSGYAHSKKAPFRVKIREVETF